MLKKYLKTKFLGKKVFYFDKISSTQSFAKKLLSENHPIEGTVIIADQQTNGYGRFQRKWFSPTGGLWVSLILRPKILLENVSYLVPVSVLSITKTIHNSFALQPKIKWPNDIVLKNKKLAGIILESSNNNRYIDWVVIGIGMNVNNSLPDEIKEYSTSIKKLVKKNVDCNKLLAEILCSLEKDYLTFLEHGIQPFVDEYRKWSVIIGKEVVVNQGKKTYKGVVKNIDKECCLLLELFDKNIIRIPAGEIVSIK